MRLGTDTLRAIKRAARAGLRWLEALPDDRTRHQDYRYRTPHDLQVTPARPLKVLMVGSCLTESLYHAARGLGHEVDLMTFNHLAELPDKPAEAVAAYDFQLVQLSMRALVREEIHFNLGYDDLAAHQALYEQARGLLAPMLAEAMAYNSRHGLLSFVSNFLVPQQNPLGRLLPRYDMRNPVHLVETLNRDLAGLIGGYANAYLLDADQVSATLGRMYHQEDHVCSTNHGSVLNDFDVLLDRDRIRPARPVGALFDVRRERYLRALCSEMEALHRTISRSDAVKLVVVDLDDTLWRGVAAEGGVGEMEGWPLGLAEALAFLKKRGVLLAILSKNDEATVAAVWDGHFRGRLALGDFAFRRIDWRPKAEGMAAILAEARLLPRNVVFVDDNPVERAAVAAAFPGIRILGEEPYDLRRILLWAAETQTAEITAESAARTQMMQAQAERSAAGERLSRADFLASLELQVRRRVIDRVGDASFARALELLNKTNQFNTTGRRWSHAELAALFRAGGVLVGFEVQDRYARYGLVGLGVVRGARIEQFVLSCRVVGLDVEIAMVAETCRLVRAAGHPAVEALTAETDANRLSRDLYLRAGFTAHRERWRLSSHEQVPAPTHVSV